MATRELRCGSFVLRFDRPLIMGVLNVTPDSFSDGGRFVDFDRAVEHGRQMVADGADIIDVGGESSRPGAQTVPVGEELERIRPVIERLAAEIRVPISVDTYKAKVAEEAFKAGATIMNDITGLTDRKMVKVAADHGAPVVVMHMKGTPKTMQKEPHYSDVVAEVSNFLRDRIEFAHDMGVNETIVDPGIGFGKTTAHNLEILRRLGEFKALGRPILVGPSRKAFIGNVTGLPVDARLEGTLAAIAIAVHNGADIVRVHDVAECRRAAQVAYAIRGV
jgi:dihydropteroate synthase